MGVIQGAINQGLTVAGAGAELIRKNQYDVELNKLNFENDVQKVQEELTGAMAQGTQIDENLAQAQQEASVFEFNEGGQLVSKYDENNILAMQKLREAQNQRDQFSAYLDDVEGKLELSQRKYDITKDYLERHKIFKGGKK